MSQEYGIVPANIRTALEQRDGAVLALKLLTECIVPEDTAEGKRQRVWELCGIYYMSQARWHEALLIFRGLYNQMLTYQNQSGARLHKGTPLVWMSDCHAKIHHPVLAKRYLMLTICEDAIRGEGHIEADRTGAYFRAVWHFGMSHDEFTRYGDEIWRAFQRSPEQCFYPEWILQELDQRWMTEHPSSNEVLTYEINVQFLHHFVAKFGSGSGQELERAAHYMLGAVPGCRAYMRKLAASTDYDVIGAFEGVQTDFRSEVGRYFVCECKDWSKPADFSAFAKFCRVLESAKCRFGILFSKHGITGEGKTQDAEREQVKVFQNAGLALVVVSAEDIQRVTQGANLVTMLREKYERIRLDIPLTTSL